MVTTVREARIDAAVKAMDGLVPSGEECRRELAGAIVDALFTNHSMDHFMIRTPAEREAAEYLPDNGPTRRASSATARRATPPCATDALPMARGATGSGKVRTARPSGERKASET